MEEESMASEGAPASGSLRRGLVATPTAHSMVEAAVPGSVTKEQVRKIPVT